MFRLSRSICFALLSGLLLASTAGAQVVLFESRTSTVIIDISGGATSSVDRRRVVDSTDLVADFILSEAYTAFDSSPEGSGTADGLLMLEETFGWDQDGYVIEAFREGSAGVESLTGIGFGQSQLNNTYNLFFEVLGDVDYELTAYLTNDPQGQFTGTVSFDNTSFLIPPVLDESTTITPTVLSGTLATGRYRLRAVMNGTMLATSSNPGPFSGASDYGLSLRLFVPEPEFGLMCASGVLVMFALSRRA